MLYTFLGADSGEWRVLKQSAYRGAGLAAAKALSLHEGNFEKPAGAAWRLQGVVSNIRYATAAEAKELRARQEPIGRPVATRAALIPIKKSAAWWTLAQDERRRIFEETSHHTAIGLDYLPAIARRLHHCRDIGGEFDFLTWFEYAPKYSDAFEELVRRLRATPEWDFVEREADIRLERD
jgi:chlorite dismutase